MATAVFYSFYCLDLKAKKGCVQDETKGMGCVT